MTAATLHDLQNLKVGVPHLLPVARPGPTALDLLQPPDHVEEVADGHGGVHTFAEKHAAQAAIDGTLQWPSAELRGAEFIDVPGYAAGRFAVIGGGRGLTCFTSPGAPLVSSPGARQAISPIPVRWLPPW